MIPPSARIPHGGVCAYCVSVPIYDCFRTFVPLILGVTESAEHALQAQSDCHSVLFLTQRTTMALATLSTPNLFATAARMLRPALLQLRALRHEERTHAVASFDLVDGLSVTVGTTLTVRADIGESDEAFLSRVYAQFKLADAEHFELSMHDGRLTAKIQFRAPGAPPSDMDQVLERLAGVSEKLQRLTEHLGISE